LTWNAENAKHALAYASSVPAWGLDMQLVRRNYVEVESLAAEMGLKLES